LEDWMFNELLLAARAAGARHLHGVYRPTPKNSLVAELLPNLGFVAENKTTLAENTYTLELAKASERPHYIRTGVGLSSAG